MKWIGDQFLISCTHKGVYYEIATAYSPKGELNYVRADGKTIGYAKDLEEAKRAVKEFAKCR